jgi:ribosomal protein S18 acetylase RimI-like enzyme
MLADAEAVMTAADDPYLRFEVDPERPVVGFSRGDAVVWSTRSPYRGLRWLYALGPADQAAALAAESHEWLDQPPYGVTFPVESVPLLPDPLRPAAFDAWDWWWIADAPAVQPGETDAGWIAEGAELRAFLHRASPRRSADPGDDRVRRWAGIHRDGRLVAAAADTQHIDGVPHLASIAVEPELRGGGLGGAITAWLTRQLLAEGAPVVTLGMYADNEPARRVYRRLGFHDQHRFISGRTPYGDIRAATRAVGD